MQKLICKLSKCFANCELQMANSNLVFGQHCTGQNPMQCCPRGSRQHCIGKIMCINVSTLLGPYFTGKNPMQCCPRGAKQHCTGTIKVMLPEQHLVTLFIKKNFMSPFYGWGSTTSRLQSHFE